MTDRLPIALAALVATSFAPAIAHAQEATGDGTATVVGTARRALERVPGSVSVLSHDDLRNIAPQSGGDALRLVPGLNVAAEDPMGLRLNVGVRGLDPNRSRKVLVLEDGIPVSLNPYGSPELYYTPPIERMDRVEVVRGSGQILWGPQTVGGVINYITRDPPRVPSGSVDLRYGNYGYLMAHATAGATHGPVGWSVDVIHRRFDGPRHLDLALTDATGRLRLQLSPRAVLRVKFNLYSESSQATYVGLTTAQFERDPSINLASNDHFDVTRRALSVTYAHRLADRLSLHAALYGYTTDRAWRRQEFDREDTGADYERVCDGAGRCGPDGDPSFVPQGRDGIFFRRTAAIRNRAFTVAGFEPRLIWGWGDEDGPVHGEVIAVARVLRETAYDEVRITATPTSRGGDPQDAEYRGGTALAGAVQARFTLGGRWHLTPGVRVESFWSEREVVRAAGVDVSTKGDSSTVAVIPGFGLAVDVARPVTLYAGLHRGYAPPRTRDAITPAGVNLQLDPELSWNAELGARLRLGRWLFLDVDGFLLEFENQIIPPSESGGTVSGGSFNANHSRHVGGEASLTVDLASALHADGLSVPLVVNYTWVPVASFVGGLYGGNRLPYAPEHLFNAQLRVIHRSGFSAQATANLVSAQFADRENTPFPSADGLVGELPTYATFDLRVAYSLRRAGLTVSLNGRNLTDQVYIANRAPQGIQPAGFRQIFVGLEWAWPST
ncbi:MAG: TonB-dependent receptor [Polyangiales bacterium]